MQSRSTLRATLCKSDIMSTPTTPNLFQLRKLATKHGYLLVKSPAADPEAEGYGLYLLVIRDSAGRGSYPRGVTVAEAAFAEGMGMTLDEISSELTRRA